MDRSIRKFLALGVAVLSIAIAQGLGLLTPNSNVRFSESSINSAPTANHGVQNTRQVVSQSDQIIQNAFDNHRSKLQVQGKAKVYRTLTDDLDGSRHQRILLRLTTGLSLLIAHNIDLAPRINGIKVGDTVEFYGVYEWNEKGGVVHWTHHDPDRRHTAGWLKHNGKTYQ